MSEIREVVIVGAARTAVGAYGGSLKDTPPVELAAAVGRAAMERAGLAAEEIQHAVFGNIIHTEPRDMYLGRVAAVNAGASIHAPAMTLNRLCGSGLQAIVSAAQLIMLGDADAALAGGAENMSRAPYWAGGMRWGQRMGDAALTDAMLAALHDPFDRCHMGVTAENVAEKWGISREEQDALAVESHRRAAHAIAKGYFQEQIVPLTVRAGRETVAFHTDEHARADATAEDLAKLPTVFKKNGTVTAGNASGINDGAAAVVLAAADFARQKGLAPLAALRAYAHAGVEPRLMGAGPIPAARKVLQKTGLSVNDMDVIESNEAFAAQALAVARELGFPPQKTNPNGSGISLGHPVGATGCILVVKALYELARIDGRYGLVTMCIGGGQGIAAVLERLR